MFGKRKKEKTDPFGRKKPTKPPRDTDSVEYRLWMADKLDEHSLRYVLERSEDGVEHVIGRDGVLSNFEGNFSVICGEKTVFRTVSSELHAWEFLSLEGAMLTGFDQIAGRERTVLVYYKYWNG